MVPSRLLPVRLASFKMVVVPLSSSLYQVRSNGSAGSGSLNISLLILKADLSILQVFKSSIFPMACWVKSELTPIRKCSEVLMKVYADALSTPFT
jgi:hypothetical protein